VIVSGDVRERLGHPPSKDQVERAIEAAGFKYHLLGLDRHFDEYRSPGDPHTGANSGHFNVSQLHQNPKVGVPITPGNMHFGEHNPFAGFGAFGEHCEGATMSKASRVSRPTWTLVLGVLSVLLTLEFWVHYLVPFMRINVRFPFWPTGAFVELLLSALLATLAAICGSRLWWGVVPCAVATLAFLLHGFAG
jgi:hypothetical protein